MTALAAWILNPFVIKVSNLQPRRKSDPLFVKILNHLTSSSLSMSQAASEVKTCSKPLWTNVNRPVRNKEVLRAIFQNFHKFLALTN